jgi:hypothetical protein
MRRGSGHSYHSSQAARTRRGQAVSALPHAGGHRGGDTGLAGAAALDAPPVAENLGPQGWLHVPPRGRNAASAAQTAPPRVSGPDTV